VNLFKCVFDNIASSCCSLWRDDSIPQWWVHQVLEEYSTR